MSERGGNARLWVRITRLLISALAIVTAIILLLVATTVLQPHLPLIGLALHPIVQAFTLQLLLVGVACSAAGILLRRLGHRRVGIAVAATSAVSTATLLVPLIALWREAIATGTSLSLSDQLACGFQSGGPVESRSVTYSHVGNESLELDMWLPQQLRSGVPAPAVVWLHGGGFVRGARGATPKWNEWLNERGYALFDVEYRLAPPARWDQAPRDVDCALGWIAMNAGQYNVDPRRIVLVGASAGGTLALLAAYTASVGPAQRECEANRPSVAAVVALYPAIDIREFWERNTVFGSSRHWSEQFIGGTPTDMPARYDFVSPLSHVRHGVPPTLVIEGVDDNVVLFKNAVALDLALGRVGSEHKLLGLPQTDHGFDRFWGSFATQITRNALGRFLDEHASDKP